MDIHLTKIDSVWMRIEADAGILQELSEKFTFEVPNARFIPSVRSRRWDGKIRLLRRGTNKIYMGLCKYIEEYAKENSYTFSKDFEITQDPHPLNFSKWFYNGEQIHPHNHQLLAIFAAVKNKRQIFLSPTGSGKSLIIYTIARNLLSKVKGKILVMVPTTSLVEQMYSDFEQYAGAEWNVEKHTTRIYSGMVREDKRIVISTWQSLYDKPTAYFDDYNVVIGDEAHLYKSKEISALLEKLVNCEYRYGCTGTLDGENCNQLILEGLFGPVFNVVSTSDLVESKHLSNFKIKCFVIKYPDEVKKANKDNQYEDEVQFLIGNDNRNKFIADLAVNTRGNTLVLFSRVESHGLKLYNLIKERTNKPVHFIYGGTDTNIREDIRKSVELAEDSIIVASSQIFSTGINIKSLANIIFSQPSKSRVRTLQSIGRALRISSKKDSATIFDISDDLTWKGKPNYTIKHFTERLKIYTEEDFKYSIKQVDLNMLYGTPSIIGI